MLFVAGLRAGAPLVTCYFVAVYFEKNIDILWFVILDSAGSLSEYFFIPHLAASNIFVQYDDCIMLTFDCISRLFNVLVCNLFLPSIIY